MYLLVAKCESNKVHNFIRDLLGETHAGIVLMNLHCQVNLHLFERNGKCVRVAHVKRQTIFFFYIHNFEIKFSHFLKVVHSLEFVTIWGILWLFSYVGTVVEKLAVGQEFLPTNSVFPCQNSSPMLHSFICDWRCISSPLNAFLTF